MENAKHANSILQRFQSTEQAPVSLSSVDDIAAFRWTKEKRRNNIIDKLRELREKNITTPIDFFIGDIGAWTETLTAEIIETFLFYAAHQRRWNEGRFLVSPSSPAQQQQNHHHHDCAHFLRRVLEIAVQRRLFQRLRFCATHNPTGSNLELPFAKCLSDVLRYGSGLERVTIQRFEISHEAASILAQGLISPVAGVDIEDGDDILAAGTAAGPQELVFDGNRFEVDPMKGHAAVKLASGLAHNTILRLLSFKGSYLHDSTLALLVRSVVGHPALKVLQVSSSDFGPETISSVQMLLSSPSCHLQQLELSHHISLTDTPTRIFDIHSFILRMPPPVHHCSLQLLDISKQELTDLDVNFLLQNLQSILPELRTLNLQLNRIRDLEAMTRDLGGDSPTTTTATTTISSLHHRRLRTLNLDYNDCFAYIRSRSRSTHPTNKLVVDNGRDGCGARVAIVLRLLEVFPQLGFLGNDFLQAMEQDYSTTSRSTCKRSGDASTGAASAGAGAGADDDGSLQILLLQLSVVQHQLDMNRCGGEYLLFRPAEHQVEDFSSSSPSPSPSAASPSLPLSVWPLVLTKANEMWTGRPPSRRANVQYHLLRNGASFCARDALS